MSGGEKVKMSKRSGKIVEMGELAGDVGKDAARYFFLKRSMESHLDFDVELAKKHTDENPVYYVQYAHARICNIVKFAAEKGAKHPDKVEVKFELISSPEERVLMRKIMDFPEVLSASAEKLEVHWLPHYLEELAAVFHRFYTEHRVVSEDPAMTSARLCLCEAVRRVLLRGLSIMGVSAPESM